MKHVAWDAGSPGRSTRSSAPAQPVARYARVIGLRAGFDGGTRLHHNSSCPRRRASRVTSTAVATPGSPLARGWRRDVLTVL